MISSAPQQGHCRSLRRGRILARDQDPVRQPIRNPVGALRIHSAVFLEQVLHEEGGDLGQAHGVFLRLCPSRHPPAFRNSLSSHPLRWRKTPGGRGKRRRLACGKSAPFDEGDRVLLFGLVRQGAWQPGARSRAWSSSRFRAARQCCHFLCRLFRVSSMTPLPSSLCKLPSPPSADIKIDIETVENLIGEIIAQPLR